VSGHIVEHTMGRAIGGSAEKARTVAGAQGVGELDGHALAGFIEAEGSFVIAPNNGGRSWLCAMTLNQRADDADMLLDIVRVTGLGRLHAVPARRTSRPQVVWSVCSKLECRELAQLLRRYPLRGRKRREFALWAAAVNRWSQSMHGSNRTADGLLRASAEELRRLRRYVDPDLSRRTDDRVAQPASVALSGFLGGFFTGEGSFSLHGSARMSVHLRADDADLLWTLRDAFGIGRVSTSMPRGVNPSARWSVTRRAELPRAIAMLDAAVLRGRKRREYGARRIGAAEYARGRDRDDDVIAAAARALAEARAYSELPLVLPTQRSPVETYIDVLRAFADEAPDGELTCTAYARARAGHPEWPTRNTLTVAFGAWEKALAAAGLGARASAWQRARASAVSGRGER
jgi:hypothetical protein